MPSDPVEALGRYLRVLSTQPRSLDALTGAGKAALAIGDANAAISFFARAEQISPRDGRIKSGLASALVQVEQPKTALKLFDEAVSLGVPEGEIAGERGLAHDLRGDSRRAQADYVQALRWRPDDEITRRLAVSQAISGDRQAALSTLDALLRRQDRAAWRIRAFVLALTGDRKGAEDVALAVMPRPQAEALAPYFGRLATLNAGQKAAAVNLGQLPSDGRSNAGSQIAYADRPPSSVPTPVGGPRSDVPLIPAGTAFGGAPAAGSAADARSPRRRPGATELASVSPGVTGTLQPFSGATPSPAPVRSPAYPVPATAAARPTVPDRPQPTTPMAPAALSNPQPPAPISQPAAASYPAPPLPPPAVASAPAVSPSAAAPPATMAASQTAALALTSQSVAGTPPVVGQAVSSALPAAPVQTGAPAGAQAVAAVSTGPLTPVGAASPGFSNDPLAATPLAASAPADPARPVFGPPAPTELALASPVSSSAVSPAAAPLIRPIDLPQSVVAPPAPAAVTPSATTNSIVAAPAPSPPVRPSRVITPAAKANLDAAKPAPEEKAVAAKASTRSRGSSPTKDEGEMDRPTKLASVDLRDVRSKNATSKNEKASAGGGKAGDAKTKDEGKKDSVDGRDAKSKREEAKTSKDLKAKSAAGKDDKSTKEGGSKDSKAAKGATTREAKDDAKADKATKTPAGERYWVQVASGANKADLGRAWERTKAKAPKLLGSQATYTAPWKQSNRLLVGPFKSEDEAQGFVNSLGKAGMGGIQFTSRGGMKVEPLGSE
jgi:Flp pilus assembly protein TadD